MPKGPVMTEKDREFNDKLFLELEKGYNLIQTIRIGDFVLEPGGKCTRVTQVWEYKNGKPESVQVGGTYGGSFYLGAGYMSYSGGLDPSISVKKLHLTDKTMCGVIWFFNQDRLGEGRGVYYEMDFRVYELVA